MALAARQKALPGQIRLRLFPYYGARRARLEMGQGLDHAWFIGFAPSGRSPDRSGSFNRARRGPAAQAAVPIGVRVMEAALTIDE
jgi:hypothetical protein